MHEQRTRQERARKQLLEAEEIEARNTAANGEDKPGGVGENAAEDGSTTVATPAKGGESTLPHAAPAKDQEEVRQSLEHIIQQVCETASGEDIGVAEPSDESKPLQAAAAATSTAEDGCDIDSGDTGNARLGADTRTVTADTALPARCEPDNRNISAPKNGQDCVLPEPHGQKAAGVGERGCDARHCDLFLARPTGCPHADDGSAGGNEVQEGVVTEASDGSNGHGVATASAPTETGERDSWAVRAALGVPGCGSTQSLAGCTTDATNTESVGDPHGSRSTFGSECSDRTDEVAVGDTQEKGSAAAAAASVVADADCLTFAAAVKVASDSVSSQNAENSNAQSSSTTSYEEGNITAEAKDTNRNDAATIEQKNNGKGVGEQQETAAAAVPRTTSTSQGTAPPPPP